MYMYIGVHWRDFHNFTANYLEKGTSRQRSEKAQSEKDSHSKNRGGKKLN